jgi:1-aminocyclopropane-1-carboxylate deaminase/D-cysteine desulfhydrase-like pyridoxal-dependent ACC family enzyme
MTNELHENERHLERAIESVPRVELASVRPTPLEQMPRLTAALGGPPLFIKRDDLTGLAFGGNKTRMFEFSLADAIEEEADTIVAGSAVQSNYCRQLAAACARLDLDLHLLLRPIPGTGDLANQGNHLLMRLCGADVTILDQPDIEHQDAAIAERIRSLEEQGRAVYHPRREDTIDLDAIAYTEVGLELVRQFRTQEIDPEAIYVAALDTTQAGLQLALEYLGSSTEVRGICPYPGKANRHRELARIANQAAERLGLNIELADSDFENTDAFVGEGYGIPSDIGLEALRTVARTEGILLDPVYTSKAMSAIFTDIRPGRFAETGEPIVFIHTGGQPAIFAYPDEALD